MLDPIVLPESGQTVHLKPHYTHRVERAFKEALTKGLSLRTEGEKVVVDSVDAGALDRAIEAALEHLVEKITTGSATLAYSLEWLLDLPEKDFEKLSAAVTAARAANEADKAAGKKNP